MDVGCLCARGCVCYREAAEQEKREQDLGLKPISAAFFLCTLILLSLSFLPPKSDTPSTVGGTRKALDTH